MSDLFMMTDCSMTKFCETMLNLIEDVMTSLDITRSLNSQKSPQVPDKLPN